MKKALVMAIAACGLLGTARTDGSEPNSAAEKLIPLLDAADYAITHDLAVRPDGADDIVQQIDAPVTDAAESADVWHCCDDVTPSASAGTEYSSENLAATASLDAAILNEKFDRAFEAGGFTGFVEHCAKREVIPFKSLDRRKDREMVFGVNFDGVLGLFVFTQ